MSRTVSSSDPAAAPVMLALETSTEIGSVALVRAGETLADAHHVGGYELSAWVLPAIERVLGRCGLSRPDAVACGVGPGAFTGVRTACATAQALAWGWSVPLYAVGSLHAFVAAHLALAATEGEPLTPGRWAVLMDARQAETYAAVWEVGHVENDALSPREKVGARAGLEAEPHGGAASHPALRAGLSQGERPSDTVGSDGLPARLPVRGLRRVVAPTLVADAALAAWLAEHNVQHALGSACAKLDGVRPPCVSALCLERVLKHSALGVGIAATWPATHSEVDPLDLQPLYVRERVALTEAERAANRLGVAAPSSSARVS